MIDHVCQIPGCPRPATWPPGVGQLCIPCRRRVKSKTPFHPLLFWGSLWIATMELYDVNRAKSVEFGKFVRDYTTPWTIHRLLAAVLAPSTGLSAFLSWAADNGVPLLEPDLAWLERFATKIENKGQRRILSSYWTMMDPDGIDRERKALFLSGTSGVFVAQILVGPGVPETVAKALVAHYPRSGGRGHLVLKTPWAVLFPKTFQLEENPA